MARGRHQTSPVQVDVEDVEGLGLSLSVFFSCGCFFSALWLFSRQRGGGRGKGDGGDIYGQQQAPRGDDDRRREGEFVGTKRKTPTVTRKHCLKA